MFECTYVYISLSNLFYALIIVWGEKILLLVKSPTLNICLVITDIYAKRKDYNFLIYAHFVYHYLVNSQSSLLQGKQTQCILSLLITEMLYVKQHSGKSPLHVSSTIIFFLSSALCCCTLFLIIKNTSNLRTICNLYKTYFLQSHPEPSANFIRHISYDHI